MQKNTSLEGYWEAPTQGYSLATKPVWTGLPVKSTINFILFPNFFLQNESNIYLRCKKCFRLFARNVFASMTKFSVEWRCKQGKIAWLVEFWTPVCMLLKGAVTQCWGGIKPDGPWFGGRPGPVLVCWLASVAMEACSVIGLLLAWFCSCLEINVTL